MASVLFSHGKEDILKAFIMALKEVGLSENGSHREFLDIDEQLDSQQTAELLRISMPTLIKKRKEGKIPFYRMGRKIWHSKQEVLIAAKSEYNFNKDQRAA